MFLTSFPNFTFPFSYRPYLAIIDWQNKKNPIASFPLWDYPQKSTEMCLFVIPPAFRAPILFFRRTPVQQVFPKRRSSECLPFPSSPQKPSAGRISFRPLTANYAVAAFAHSIHPIFSRHANLSTVGQRKGQIPWQGRKSRHMEWIGHWAIHFPALFVFVGCLSSICASTKNKRLFHLKIPSIPSPLFFDHAFRTFPSSNPLSTPHCWDGREGKQPILEGSQW